MRLRIERLKPRLLIPGLFHVRSGQIPTIARAALGKNAEKRHDITDMSQWVSWWQEASGQDELGHGPVFLFFGFHKLQAEFPRFFLQEGDIVGIETAHVDFRAGMHGADVGRHVVQQHVAVDVGDEEVERWFSL